jgi:uncharacterized protein YndB with AHSA1/START domain
MTVVRTEKDSEALALTLVAELAAPPSRVWQVWADPRQLERWWGPPTWPATFEEHELAPGGGSRYYLTGPAGEKSRGWWRCLALDEPHYLEFEDGFSDDSGEPNPTMPTVRGRVELEETPAGTRMTVTTRFATLEHMEQLVRMGMVEGMAQAIGQIDEVLATV